MYVETTLPGVIERFASATKTEKLDVGESEWVFAFREEVGWPEDRGVFREEIRVGFKLKMRMRTHVELVVGYNRPGHVKCKSTVLRSDI